MRNSYRPLAAILLTVPILGFLPAQEAESIEDRVATAQAHADKGRDQRALAQVRAILQDQPTHPEALALAVELAENLGETQDWLRWSEAWVAAAAGDSESKLQRARALLRTGRLEPARDLLQSLVKNPADSPAAVRALELLAQVERRRVGKSAAKTLWERVVKEGQGSSDPKALVAVARAETALGGKPAFRRAEALLAKRAQPALPTDPEPFVAASELYREKFHLPGDAVEEAKLAEKARPNWAEAIFQKALSYSSWMKGGEAEAALQGCLSINPHHPEALCVQISDALGNLEMEKARRGLDRVFAVDAAHPTGWALRAAERLVSLDQEGFAAALEKAKASAPDSAEPFLAIAAVLNERRRWGEALEFAEQGAKADPDSAKAHDLVARFAFFLGQETKGVAALRAADRTDAFGHPWRANMFEVTRWVGKHYTTRKSEHFVHVLDQKENLVYGDHLLRFCEASYELLVEKYGYEPPGLADDPGRVLVVSFSDHESFSVRTLGFTNLGALGVCFGPLILLDSPKALPTGANSWARTFHHEFSHTLALGLSKGRTTRWLTEGLSTYEEFALDPSWTRGMDRELWDAWKSDDLIPVAEFDRYFTSARVGFAYFQAGLVCQWIAETQGFPKILDLLKQLGSDVSMLDAIERVLQLSPDEFDAGFRGFVARRLEGFRLTPRWTPVGVAKAEARLAANPNDDEALLRLAWAAWQSGNKVDAEARFEALRSRAVTGASMDTLEAWLADARGRKDVASEVRQKLSAAGQLDYDTALAMAAAVGPRGDPVERNRLLEAAVQAFPSVSGAQSPRLALAAFAVEGGQNAVARRWLEEHLATSHEDVASRKKLLELTRADQDWEATLRHQETLIRIQPFDLDLQLNLAADYERVQRSDQAAMAWRHSIELTPEKDGSDRAARWAELARVHWRLRQDADEADAAVKAALALDPNQSLAQEIQKALAETRKSGSGDRD